MNFGDDKPAAYDGLMVSLGRNVATAREACGWTQSELASRASIGRSTVAKIESFNTSDVSLSTVSGLAHALNVPPFILFLEPSDWAKMASLTSIPDLVRARGPQLEAETIDRLADMARSESKVDQRQARAQMEELAAEMLGVEPAESQVAASSSSQESLTPWPSLAVSTALGASMLPGLPVLNAVIGGILSRAKKTF